MEDIEKHLRAHIKMLLVRAGEQEGLAIAHVLDWNEWSSRDTDQLPPEQLVYGDDEYIEPFKHTLISLHESVVCYLDHRNLHVYLKVFQEKFGETLDAKSMAIDIETPNEWVLEPQSTLLMNLRRFLMPLGLVSDAESYARTTGIAYLENILESTANIIQRLGLNPTQESHVYDAVKVVVETVFPSSIKAKSNFLKIAQEYKPDILIPELGVAVEYKYASDEAKLKATVDTIHADVKGYTGDDTYQNFYAVFYVTNDIWGRPRFKQVWEEKQFPKNWRAYYVVGK